MGVGRADPVDEDPDGDPAAHGCGEAVDEHPPGAVVVEDVAGKADAALGVFDRREHGRVGRIAAIERLEKDAVERYEIADVVTNKDVLSRIEPNETLLKAVMRTKHLMNPEVLALARELVRRVVEELLRCIAPAVEGGADAAAGEQATGALGIRNGQVQAVRRVLPPIFCWTIGTSIAAMRSKPRFIRSRFRIRSFSAIASKPIKP